MSTDRFAAVTAITHGSRGRPPARLMASIVGVVGFAFGGVLQPAMRVVAQAGRMCWGPRRNHCLRAWSRKALASFRAKARKRQQHARQPLLAHETEPLPLKASDRRTQHRHQCLEPRRFANMPRHDNQAPVRGDRRPDLHLDSTYIEESRSLSHHPLGDTMNPQSSNSGAGLSDYLGTG